MTSATTEQRLAALRSRRGIPEGSAASEAEPLPRPTGRTGQAARRRSPAAASKILVVGASTTAVFGIVTAMGLADRTEGGAEEAVDGSSGSIAAVPDTAAAVPVAPIEPVVVVILDAEGTPLAATTIDPGASDPAVVSLDFLATEPVQPQPAKPKRPKRVAPAEPEIDLERVAVPVVVDVAVPAPPVPRASSAWSSGRATAPAQAPAQAPAPAQPAASPPPSEGTSSGS